MSHRINKKTKMLDFFFSFHFFSLAPSTDSLKSNIFAASIMLGKDRCISNCLFLNDSQIAA